MRETKQRREILAYMRSKRQHLSASQIYDAVREKIPNISLGTVYRNLGNLLEDGEIIAVETSDKCVYYDGFIKGHSHFVCRECKTIFDFPLPDDDTKKIRDAGFEIESEKIVYYGLCSECKNK